MFTGLIAEKGALLAREPSAAGVRLRIGTPAAFAADLVLGESVAVSGCCLTVAATDLQTGFEADASPETLEKTSLGAVPIGGDFNLERALQVGDRLGGHMVSGHVDGVGTVTKVSRPEANADVLFLQFAAPAELAKYIATKGSITIDGVSLTVNHVEGVHFDVMLIPVTLEKTSLGTLAVGSKVNLEVDLVARYLGRLLESRDESRVDLGGEARR